ncbi:hypothetical protein LINPERPRIM_LOCUS18490 [Linum perenne]
MNNPQLNQPRITNSKHRIWSSSMRRHPTQLTQTLSHSITPLNQPPLIHWSCAAFIFT